MLPSSPITLNRTAASLVKIVPNDNAGRTRCEGSSFRLANASKVQCSAAYNDLESDTPFDEQRKGTLTLVTL
jgi:hypothetical protein